MEDCKATSLDVGRVLRSAELLTPRRTPAHRRRAAADRRRVTSCGWLRRAAGYCCASRYRFRLCSLPASLGSYPDVARSHPGSLPGRLLSHTTLRSRSRNFFFQKKPERSRSHTPNTTHSILMAHSQIVSPHGPTTPSSHVGPLNSPPRHTLGCHSSRLVRSDK